MPDWPRGTVAGHVTRNRPFCCDQWETVTFLRVFSHKNIQVTAIFFYI